MRNINIMKKYIICLFVFVFALILSGQTTRAEELTADEIYSYAEDIIEYLGGTDKIYSSKIGESVTDWIIIGTAGLGLKGDTNLVISGIDSCIAKIYSGNIANTQATQWHRSILLSKICGGDFIYQGHNLLSDGIYNRRSISELGRQGINGWIWGLIALDASGADVPEGADYRRRDIISEILSLQHEDGSFSLMGAGDSDITAMTLYSLSTYAGINDVLPVSDAINRALSWLSAAQQPDGSYASMGAANAESTAQVIIALTSLGINPQTDSRFIKNGNSALDALLNFRTEEGAFAHVDNKVFNGLASAQSLLALSSLYRVQTGQPYIFRMAGAPFAEYLRNEFYEKETESETQPTEIEITTIVETTAIPETTIVPELSTEVETEAAETTIIEVTTIEVTTIEATTIETAAIETTTIEATVIETTVAETAITEATTALQGTSNEFITTEVVKAEEEKDESGISIKKILTVIFAILAAAVLISAVMVRRYRKLLLVILGIIIVTLILLNVKLQSVDDYYSSQNNDERYKVELSIKCDTALEHFDELPEGIRAEGKLPKDGRMLEAEIGFDTDGTTVFDILLKATKENNLQMEYTGSQGSAYIKGIGYLYEYDAGPLSGWMYSVNGEFPGVSCGEYVIKAGDKLCFEYTCDLGRDIGNEYSGD